MHVGIKLPSENNDDDNEFKASFRVVRLKNR